ncbi:hypothetical protein VE03_05724 [Pseudogymnoascus sp. 23342-1-I1]|nr:hypothetical protein VE03_05724 [Pseudogymnoascus sp. 23342-1-I1]
MEPLKAEPVHPKWRNVHLRLIYREAEEFDVNKILRRYIALSSLHNLLLGQGPLVPSWLPVDGDTGDPEFWIEALTEVSDRSNEHLCSGAASSFHDSLEVRSRALCTSHALDHLRKKLSPDSCSKGNPVVNSNGKRPRSDTNGPPSRNPPSTGTASKLLDERNLPLEKWLNICDGTKTSWKDTHFEWNRMIRKYTAASTKSWDSLETNWPVQGLALSLGYFANIFKNLLGKCRSLISRLTKGRTESNNPPRPSYIGIVRRLGNSWPAAKNTEFESCILEVIGGFFREGAANELVGFMIELEQMIDGPTITVRNSEVRRQQARQLEEEQKENDIKQREELCRQAEENLGRESLALDDERDSIDMISAGLRKAQAICDERERILAVNEASFADRGGELEAREVSCAERVERAEESELRLQKKLEAYKEGQRLLLEGQRRVKKGDDNLARTKVAMERRDTSNTGREKGLNEKEQRLNSQEKKIVIHRTFITQKENAVGDRERLCITKEAELAMREEALGEGQATVASEIQDLETQRAALRQEQSLYLKANGVLKEREETLSKNQAEVLTERQGVEAQKLAFQRNVALHREKVNLLKTKSEELAKEMALLRHEQKDMAAARVASDHARSALRAEQATVSRKVEEVTTARKALEDEKTALRKGQTALSDEKKEAAVAKQALEDEKSALTAKQALFEGEKIAWRGKVGKTVQQMKQMQENMQDMQESLPPW